MKGMEGVEPAVLTEKPLIYIDTAGSEFEESWNELLESHENSGEAELALRIYQQLRRLGVPPQSGVFSRLMWLS